MERRDGLVDIARRAAATAGASRATFIHTDIDAVSFDGYDGIYLYNPFFEQSANTFPSSTKTWNARPPRTGTSSAPPSTSCAPRRGRSSSSPITASEASCRPSFVNWVTSGGNDRLEMWMKR